MTNLIHELNRTREKIDKHLSDLLPSTEGLHQRIIESMRYSLLGNGKALRPFLVVTTAKLFNLSEQSALRIGCALEMVHTYSLIHDDLPAMDNDTLRRGKPTNHVRFDEATAILAGDALLTYAFEILSDPKTHPDATVRCRLISSLAKGAGMHGMIGGQMIDLIGEKTKLSPEQIKQMQTMKTGALLHFSCLAAAFATQAPQDEREALENYAYHIGLLFQLTDDLLDVEGDTQTVGKTLHKDKGAHKSTFISLFGIQRTREMAQEQHKQAIQSLKIFDDRTDTLKELADFILTRRN